MKRSASDVGQRLDDLSADPLLRGIRPMLQDIDDTHWIERPDVMVGVRAIAELNLRLDALVQSRHLPTLLRVAERIPDLTSALREQVPGGTASRFYGLLKT